MTQAYNLAILANAVNTSGQLNVGTNATGTLPVANGGTSASTLPANNVLLGNGTSALQAVAPGTNGNYLRSNGTTWVSQAGATGTVSSVATGNGLSGGTITTTGTLSIACPGANTVGSYFGNATVQFLSIEVNIVYGNNYATGGGNAQISTSGLSGTWKWMQGGVYTPGETGVVYGMMCKVA